MQVGELSSETGVSVRAIRYYEQEGLIHATRRDNGYRDFGAGTAERVRAIRDLLASGFTLDEIRSLGACLAAGPAPKNCRNQTASLYRAKLAQLDGRLDTLTALRQRVASKIEELDPCPTSCT